MSDNKNDDREKKERKKWKRILLNMDIAEKKSQQRFFQAQKSVKMDMREQGKYRESTKDAKGLNSDFRSIWR